MFDFIRKIMGKRRLKKNYQSKRYVYEADGITKRYLEKES